MKMLYKCAINVSNHSYEVRPSALQSRLFFLQDDHCYPMIAFPPREPNSGTKSGKSWMQFGFKAVNRQTFGNLKVLTLFVLFYLKCRPSVKKK